MGIQMETSLRKADISTRGLRKNGVRDINLEVISTWKVFKAPSGRKKIERNPVTRQERRRRLHRRPKGNCLTS